MKQAIFFLGFLLLLSAVFLPQAEAAKVDIATQLQHTNSTTYNQNTYAVGIAVASDSVYEKDLFLAGLGSTIFSGTTKEDLIIIGGDVQITGTVKEDVRAFGGVVKISGTVSGDVVMLGGSLFIEDGAVIEGDVLLVGGTIAINAPLLSKTNVIAGSIVFNNTISANNVVVTTYRLKLDSNTKLTGSMTYFSPRQVAVNENAVVSGSLTYNRINPLQDDGLIDQAIVSFLNFWVVLRFVTTLMLAFLLVFVFRVFTQRTVDVAQRSLGKSFFVGIISLFAIPILFVVLISSLILFPVGILLLLASIFFWIIAGAIAGVIVGVIVRKYFIILRTETKDEEEENALHKQTYDISFNSAVIGVVLLTLIEFVPYVGEVMRLIFILIAFGALWLTFYKYVRWGSLFTSFNKRKK